MKQRLQKLVVLGLAVATVAGSSVPVYAAEIMPESKMEVTSEVVDNETPSNTEEQAVAPSVSVPATWDGNDLTITLNRGTSANVKVDHVFVMVNHGEEESGWNAYDEADVTADTVVVPKSAIEGAMKQWETANGAKFEYGRIEIMVLYMVDGQDVLTPATVVIPKQDGGEEQKPGGGEEQKPGGGDENQGGDNNQGGNNTQKPDGDGNGTTTPEQKPNDTQKPSVKPQTNNTTIAPKTGDVAGVAGLMGTCAGSLGVALMALKKRFRK